MPAFSNGPVKLDDVVRNYKKNPIHLAQDEDEKGNLGFGKENREDHDYQFDRWEWYWRRHLDVNGYLVNPLKTWQEWEKAMKAQGEAGAGARTTAGSTSNWVFQGPDSTPGGYSGIGRINVMTFHPSSPNVIYAGAAGGGLWKSIDTGHSWVALYGNYPTLGVSDIVINPLNPNTIYVATGDADGWSNYSLGILKSTDGGTTWHNTSVAWTPSYYDWARSIVINPLDTNKLMLASRAGITVTNDGFVTAHRDTSGDFKQLLYNTYDTNIVYASKYPVYPDSSAQILRSTDGGRTWVQVTSFTDAQRINLAVCPSSPDVVKAIVSNMQSGLEGIYNSTDSGASFTAIYTNDTSCTHNLLSWDMGMPSTSCGGQGWYDLCIAMNPTDPNKVVIGGVNTYCSTDGGYSWQLATAWYGISTGAATVHADKHCLKYNPLDLQLYEGCDGGLYRTSDPMGSWLNITNGMGITQFYRNAVANGAPFVIGGAQDNGTKMINAGTYSDLTGGDGMQCQIDYVDPYNIWYTASQYGSINKTTNGGATYENISSTVPDTLSGIWLTPYVIHPNNNSTLLVGIDFLFASTDLGVTWNPISPQFTPLSKISRIAMTSLNGDYIYVEIEGAYNYHNSIYYTRNFGGSWDTITTATFAESISDIAIDPHDVSTLWVTFGGYGPHKVASYNLNTAIWTMRGNSSLPDVPVNCIVIDSFSGTRYIGTDIGVYYMDTSMSYWTAYTHGLPTVQVEDLNINYSSNEMWAATYGRGMWKTIKREIPNGVSVVPFVDDAVTAAPNPNKGFFTLQTSSELLKGRPVSARLLATNGVTVWQEATSFDASGSLKISARGLVPGAYICEVKNDATTARCRIIIY